MGNCQSCGPTNWKASTPPLEFTSIKMFPDGRLIIYSPEGYVVLMPKDCITIRRPGKFYEPDHTESKRLGKFRSDDQKAYFTNLEGQTIHVATAIMDIVWKTLFNPDFGNNTKVLKKKNG